jgi:hypothetical protein
MEDPKGEASACGVGDVAIQYTRSFTKREEGEVAEGTKKELISRVGKLLALANDEGATEAEKTSAAHHAAKLMYKYGIEESEVSLEDDNGPVMAEEEILQTGTDGKRQRWVSELAYVIAKTFDCQVMNTRRYRKIDEVKGMYWFLHFVGLKSDVEVTTYFYKFLSRTVRRKTEAHPYGTRRDFAFGMIAKLEDRLTEAFKFRYQFAEEAGTTDLIVVKDALVEDKMKNLFPRAKDDSRIKLRNRDAYFAGQKAGEKVNISRPIEGNNAPKQERLANRK